MDELDYMQDATSWVMNLGAVPLTIFSCLLVGYVFRVIPAFPNKWIPLVVILTGEIFLLVNPRPSSTPAVAFYAHSAVGGLFIGLLSWLGHDKWISSLEDKVTAKFPKAAVLFTSTESDGTKFVGRPKPPV